MKKILFFTLISLLSSTLCMSQTIYVTGQIDGDWGPTNEMSNYQLGGFDYYYVTIQATGAYTDAAFLFEADAYYNKWNDVTANVNTVNTYTWNDNYEGSNNVIDSDVSNGNYYTFRLKDNAYADANGVVMETSGSPITISSVDQVGTENDVSYYASTAAQTVNITLSGSKSTEEKIYIRYSTDGFLTDDFVEASGATTSYSADIPSQSVGTVVEYYVLTTTLTSTGSGDLDTYPDLCTINYDNNSGSNYTYIVGRETTQAGVWNTAGTWLDNAVPTGSTDDVIIGHTITVDEVGGTDAECDDIVIKSGGTLTSDNNGAIGYVIHGTVVIHGNAVIRNGAFFDITKKLFVKSGGNVTIEPGGELTVDGTTSQGGTFTIQSDASKTGSFIPTGGFSNSGTTTVQRYMTGYSTDANGWHFLSPPVSGFTISGSDFEPSSGVDDLFRFDETAASLVWLNYTGGTFSQTEFEVGLGYLTAYNTASTKSFSGSINTGSVAKSLSFTASSGGEGWNLIGNPYTSAIDWDLLTKTGSVEGSVYVVQATDGNYISWNGTTGDLTNGIIPAMQGYFVHCTTTGQTVTMETADQLHNSTNFYKSSQSLADGTFKVSVGYDDYSNNTYIQLRDDATKFFDGTVDAYKLFGYNEEPQIFTNDGESIYSINCLPSNMENYSLPLNIKIEETGEYELTFSDIENVIDKFDIKLEDTKTGYQETISSDLIYPFTFTEGDGQERFTLHFSSVLGVNDNTINDDIRVFSTENRVKIKVDKPIDATINIYNIAGQLITTSQLNNESSTSLSIQDYKGVAIVSITTSGQTINEKVIIW